MTELSGQTPMGRLHATVEALRQRGYNDAFATLSYTTKNPGRVEIYFFAERVGDKVTASLHEHYSDMEAAIAGLTTWADGLPAKGGTFVHPVTP